MTTIAWTAVLVFAVAYVLIATEWFHRVQVALGGAIVMLLIGATDAEHAFFSEEAGVDWNVIVLLLGMMLIVAVLQRTGVFEYVAIWAAKRAQGRPYRLMVLLCVVTAAASAVLDNVTTVLLVAPVTLVVCKRLALPVVPFLIAEVFASNIGGTATLVGDPPNIIIGSRADLSYVDFLMNLAPLVVILMGVLLLLCRVMFRSAFTYNHDRVAEVMAMNERSAIKDRRLLTISLSVLTVVTLAFVFQGVIHAEPSVIALIGGLVLLALSRLEADDVARDVEWPTLIFFMGLFIMVGALVNTGAIGQLATVVSDAAEGHLPAASISLLWGSGLVSAIVDNIPYVATMSPVVEEVVHAHGDTEQARSLWWSLTLGADLGGNATAIGASANVVVLGIAEHAGIKISFWEFTKYGLIVATATIAVATPYVWLRYLAVG